MPLFLKPNKNAREFPLEQKHALNTIHVNTPINIEATVTNFVKSDNVVHDLNAKHLKYAIEFYAGPTLLGAWVYATSSDRDADYSSQLGNL